jgi:hypothetical protein
MRLKSRHKRLQSPESGFREEAPYCADPVSLRNRHGGPIRCPAFDAVAPEVTVVSIYDVCPLRVKLSKVNSNCRPREYRAVGLGRPNCKSSM